MGQRSHGYAERFATMRELLAFFWHAKTWWLVPVVVVLLVLSVVVVFLQTSPVAVFIYTLF